MDDDRPTWETMSDTGDSDDSSISDSSSDSSSSSDEQDNAFPRLYLRTPCLVGPATLVPLPLQIHRRLIIEQHRVSSEIHACTYHKVDHILQSLNNFRITHKTASEKLRQALGNDDYLLNLFVTTYPCIFAEGNDDYVFTPYNTPLILRPTYVADQDETHVPTGQSYDAKVSVELVIKRGNLPRSYQN
jgi:hypothetical protein